MNLRSLLFTVLLSACASRGPVTLPEPPEAEQDAEAPVLDASPSGDYGTEHPFVLQGAAEDGRWLIGCQAREDTTGDGSIDVGFGHHGSLIGDALRPYLFLEPGPGIPIDEVLAEDPTGRYLALVRDGTLRLFDTNTREEQVLASGVPLDTESPQPPARAAFSGDGTRLLFLRPEGAKRVAVVRELAAGTERVLDAGGGLLGQALLDSSGQWAVFDVVAKDTDGDGKLTWPQERTTLASALCRGPVSSSSHYGWQGDMPVRRFRRVEGGLLREGDDILQPFGGGLLRRAPDRAILFEHADGRRESWVPADCNGEVLYADAQRQQLLVACAVLEPSWPLELHGAGVHQSLGWRVPAERERSRPWGRNVRLVAVKAFSSNQPKDVPVAIDLARRTVQPLPVASAEVELVAAHGPRALLKESYRPEGEDRWQRRIWLWNAETGEKVSVGEPGDYIQERAGDKVLYLGWLVDLRRGRVLGAVEGEPLAIDSRGRVLHARQFPERGIPGARGGMAPLGPVRWEPAVKAPAPAPAPGTP
ncbi:hypothetical protein [Pyxidicoccus xibeiensis]|uniref:hypothetical protein n=1 Tax=Pyxidicoccus xibeiensis TaxID=2906759 RepID=UPI0020A7E1A3|nr:hypothetical protein [Pyxidicoccus xibeiensis]MCP3136847.1 hypothetical protein [Pyxidicoccus xibeiensis]